MRLTLKQYQEFNSIEDPSEEDLLRCFVGLSVNKINELSLDKFNNLVNSINLEINKEVELSPRFVLNGVEYGFIPNLDEISYGENKDLTSYVSDWSTMHKAMAVAYRPVTQKNGNKYLIEKYEGTGSRSDIMLDAPFHIVAGMVVFFWNLTNDLLGCIPNYLEKEMKEMKETKDHYLTKNGEAIEKCISSLKATLPSLKR
jgi:hypothetical protein